MALVGMSLVLADRGVRNGRHFWRRIAIIAACALRRDRRERHPASAQRSSISASCTPSRWRRCWHRPSYAGRAPRSAIGAAVIAAGLVWSHPRSTRVRCRGSGSSTRQACDRGLRAPGAVGGVRVPRDRAGAPARAQGFPRARAARPARPRGCAGSGGTAFVYMVHQPILLGGLWLVVGP